MTEHECTCTCGAAEMAAIRETIHEQTAATRELTERLNGIERRIERAVEKGARNAKDRDRLVAVAVRGGRR